MRKNVGLPTHVGKVTDTTCSTRRIDGRAISARRLLARRPADQQLDGGSARQHDLDGARKVLAESAVDLGSKGRDPVFGAGRIDAQSALARVLPVATARP